MHGKGGGTGSAGLVRRSAEGALPPGTRILEARAFDGGYVKHFFASEHWPDDYANWKKEREKLLSTAAQ